MDDIDLQHVAALEGRIANLETEVKRLRGTLESVREYARTDIELETVGVMTTSIMAIAIAALEPAP